MFFRSHGIRLLLSAFGDAEFPIICYNDPRKKPYLSAAGRRRNGGIRMFEYLLRPGKIGTCEIRNRFVMPAMGSGHS